MLHSSTSPHPKQITYLTETVAEQSLMSGRIHELINTLEERLQLEIFERVEKPGIRLWITGVVTSARDFDQYIFNLARDLLRSEVIKELLMRTTQEWYSHLLKTLLLPASLLNEETLSNSTGQFLYEQLCHSRFGESSLLEDLIFSMPSLYPKFICSELFYKPAQTLSAEAAFELFASQLKTDRLGLYTRLKRHNLLSDLQSFIVGRLPQTALPIPGSGPTN